MEAISMAEIRPASTILTRNGWNTSYFRDRGMGVSFIGAGPGDAELIWRQG
jgi:hypothetical protein